MVIYLVVPNQCCEDGMHGAQPLQKRRGGFWSISSRVIISGLALIGAAYLIGGPIMRFALRPLYVVEVVKTLPSPDQKASAQVEVTRGGFGTVWTTRVSLQGADEDRWTIYETGDSDFVPTLTWSDGQTLVVALPCERVDHLSNPDDWERADPSEPRLKVRFEYVAKC